VHRHWLPLSARRCLIIVCFASLGTMAAMTAKRVCARHLTLEMPTDRTRHLERHAPCARWNVAQHASRGPVPKVASRRDAPLSCPVAALQHHACSNGATPCHGLPSGEQIARATP
jgi:hypothetical protein